MTEGQKEGRVAGVEDGREAREELLGPSVVGMLLPWQVVLATLWMLYWLVVPPPASEGEIIAFWLPLNYVLFDLYVLLRGGARSGSYEGSSLPVMVLLRLSPVLMVFSALCLGRFGSDLREML